MALRVAGTRLTAARSEPRSLRSLLAWWEAVLIAVLTAAIVVRPVAGRSFRIPDTVPDGLVQNGLVRKEPAGI
jgi:hypothetical protein